jgi:hypothetical protein
MKIVLASALYPPDIAPPAVYIKELARRLAPRHEVTAVVYGRLPEEVAGVRVVAVDKRRALPLRLASFMRALWRSARGADAVLIENGASVELPALLVSLFARAPLFVHFGDTGARVRARESFFLHVLERILLPHARGSIDESPAPRPEILPFVERPDAALEQYERSWKAHIEKLEQLFKHAH